jgi:hypothetical protein
MKFLKELNIAKLLFIEKDESSGHFKNMGNKKKVVE